MLISRRSPGTIEPSVLCGPFGSFAVECCRSKAHTCSTVFPRKSLGTVSSGNGAATGGAEVAAVVADGRAEPRVGVG
eukprot:9472733-Pyramimonas_sp.AAC.1